MGKFSYENNGVIRHLVYALETNEQIDQISLGMLTTAQLVGFIPASCTQFDEERYIKYDITGTLPLNDFVQKETAADILQLTKDLAHLLDSTVDAMLDPAEVLLKKEFVLVDQESKTLRLICLPVPCEEPVSLVSFLKELLPELLTQAKLSNRAVNDAGIWNTVTFLYQTPDASPAQVEQFLQNTAAASLYAHETAEPPVQQPPVQQPPTQQPPIQQPPVQQQPTQQPKTVMPPVAGDTASAPDGRVIRNGTIDRGGMQIPGGEPKEKRGLLGGIFGQKKDKKEPKKKTPPMPDPVKFGNDGGMMIPGMAIPGAENSRKVTPATPTDPVQPDPLHSRNGREGTSDMSGVKKHRLTPCLIEKLTGRRIVLDRFPYSIGSDPAQNSLVLQGDQDDYTVSSKHAYIQERNGGYYVVDCGTEGKGSHNGTYLNGSRKRITPNKEYRITHNKSITFADQEFTFQLL